MRIIESAGSITEFDPKTITYRPFAGSPTPGHTKSQLLAGADYYGLTLEEVPDGYMAYHYWDTDQLKFPRQVSVWDLNGRLVRVDFVGTVSARDIRGELEGEQSPLFSNVYKYDEHGRLVESSQVVTQNDFSEYVYGGEIYEYSADGSWTYTEIAPGTEIIAA